MKINDQALGKIYIALENAAKNNQEARLGGYKLERIENDIIKISKDDSNALMTKQGEILEKRANVIRDTLRGFIKNFINSLNNPMNHK